MNRPAAVLIALCVVAFVVGLCGCGGGGDAKSGVVASGGKPAPGARYHLEALDSIGTGGAVNSLGEVAGQDMSAGTRPCFWGIDKVVAVLAALPGEDGYGVANDINDASQVVGMCNWAGPSLPTLWQKVGGVWTPTKLPLPSEERPDLKEGEAVGMASGTAGLRVAGSLWADDVERAAVLWTQDAGGQWTANLLGTLPGATTSSATDVNSSGVVVGRSKRAFLWNGTTMRDLGELSAGKGSRADHINAAGTVVVGSATTSKGVEHAARWTLQGGQWKIQDLGTTGGIPCSRADDINSSGQVVGTCFNYPDLTRTTAFLWENGVMSKLSGLVDASGQGWDLRGGHGINDAGQIVGSALKDGVWRAYRLTPLG